MTDYTMPEASPPARKGELVGPEAEKFGVRRNQLKSNPSKWYLWQDDAPKSSGLSAVLLLLSELPTSARVSRKELAFKGRTKRNPNGTYSYFVSYDPTNQPYYSSEGR
jgi:hypothetical protein